VVVPKAIAQGDKRRKRLISAMPGSYAAAWTAICVARAKACCVLKASKSMADGGTVKGG
jgi:hypothetical protein